MHSPDIGRLNAQTVYSEFYGQNLWMPFTIGNRPTPLNGKLEMKWTEFNQSGAMTFRFGGADVEGFVNHDHVISDYTAKISQVVAFRPNARFVLQLPFAIGNVASGYTADLEGAALQAKDIVTDVMSYVSTLSPQPEIMWMICNEPDHSDGLGLTGYAGAQSIRNYVKRFSERIREADATSPIIAPGLSSFRNYDSMIDYLTDKNDATTYILPYITHFSFHFYPFNHQAKYDPDIPGPTRANVTNILRSPVSRPGGGFTTPITTNIDYLENRIDNSDHPNIKIVITEANICYGNDVGDPAYNYTIGNSVNPGDQTNDGINGYGANSFIAGQFWTELMCIGIENELDFISFWSVIEGKDGTDSDLAISLNKGNIGFIDNVNDCKKSTYYHYQLMSDYFSPSPAYPATFFPGVALDNSSVPQIIPDLKVFGVKRDNEHYAIMLMNQNPTEVYSFVADASGTAVTGNDANISLALSGCPNQMSGTISPNSTVLMYWDENCAGVGNWTYNSTMAGNCTAPEWTSGLVVPLSPTAEIVKQDATCSGGYMNGSAEITNINSWSGSTSILWSTGSTSSIITGLKPGTYSVTVTDNGLSTSTTYYAVINGDFYQPKAISTNTDWKSNLKIASTITVQNGATLNIYSPLIEFSPDSKLIVGSGAVLNIKNGSTLQPLACGTTWAGIEVKPGGVLNIENNAIVKINGTGKLFVDDGGTFNYAQGVAIHLLDNTSIMEIKGQLNIAANADFTYTGNGFVKFSNPNSPSNNITAGSGSSMTFERSSSSQKALEVTQESLLGPANLASFKINRCNVVLNSNARIAPLGLTTQITCTNASITSFAGRGLSIFGQPSVIISNTTFNGGKVGLYALLTYAGNPLTLTNCTFQNCLIGLKSHDKGITLNNVRFLDCSDAGWEADAMSQPSVSNNGNFGTVLNPNGTGIRYHGGGNGALFLNNSKINGNYSSGIDMAGTELKIKCGEIKENYGHGIYLEHNATLNMSNDLGGGNVDASGNGDPNMGYHTIFMNKAKNLWLNNGFNHLATRGNVAFHCTATSVGCLMAIKGTMNIEYDPCDNTNCSPITINEYQNDWLNPGNALMARNGVEYDVKTSYNCVAGPRTIILNDAFPSSLVLCEETKPHILDVLATCPTCPTINTTSFPNVKLNVAVKYALEKIEVPGGGSKLAEELFYEILKQPYPLADLQTKTLLEISYQLMLESLGHAFLKTELSVAANTPVLSPNVQKMIEIHNDRLVKYPCAEYYQQRLAASMEKAQTYRLAGRRDLAIAEFDDILTWVGVADLPYVQRWRCITNAELLLTRAQIQPEEFENAIASCGSIGRIHENSGISEVINSAAIKEKKTPRDHT
jgi:hypothetical protein